MSLLSHVAEIIRTILRGYGVENDLSPQDQSEMANDVFYAIKGQTDVDTAHHRDIV